MTPDRAAEAVRAVQSTMQAMNEELLDKLIARLLTPVELKWHDACVEAPPEGVRVLVGVHAYGRAEIIFATYEGYHGQDWHVLPNEKHTGYWTVHQGPTSTSTYEGGQDYRWWMPLPIAPSP